MIIKNRLFDINHLNTIIEENIAKQNNVVNEQETIHKQ